MEGPASIEHHGDHSVVRVVGEVDLANVSQVESTLRSAIGDASGPLVIDLSDLAYLDSAGVRALFAAARAAGNEGVSLRAALPPSSPGHAGSGGGQLRLEDPRVRNGGGGRRRGSLIRGTGGASHLSSEWWTVRADGNRAGSSGDRAAAF